MSSPNRRTGSPKKRLTSAISPKKSVMNNSYFNEEQNNTAMIDLQEKDIEIERLQTTCFTLNNRVSVTDDLH